MSVLALGVNDYLQNKPVADFRAKLVVYLDAVKSIGGIALISDFIFNEPPFNPYKTELREAAFQYGMQYLDFSRMWFGANTATPFNGLLSTDGTYPTDAGHEHIGNTISRALGLASGPTSCRGSQPSSGPRSLR